MLWQRFVSVCLILSNCISFLLFTKAFVWGLNDRGQLGSELSEARVKVPFESRALAKLRPIQFVGGAKTLFIISQDGKVKEHSHIGWGKAVCTQTS